MKLPVHACLETSEANTDGYAATLYYEELPTLEEVRDFFSTNRLRGNINVDTEDEFFEFIECPNPVSDRAKLHRIQVHPTC